MPDRDVKALDLGVLRRLSRLDMGDGDVPLLG